eukprot:TRINITY_DN57528_c0_g1_i1.p1 TRINITY_DN57528_c0_g1~~TRINITY_DN57528_c0_g1_i1.p1  ORF type:complete len:276 (+),score=55.72 TRINITY_DN57528_c0_g1_i1:76-828(+)
MGGHAPWALLRSAGAVAAGEGPSSTTKGAGGYQVFIVRGDGASQPVEVEADGTVGDLREAGGIPTRHILHFQGEELRDPALTLADAGIGAQAVVHVQEVNLADDEILVEGAGAAEVNGIYKAEKSLTNGSTMWRKVEGDTQLCMHWYWGPAVNGRSINGWLFGRSGYVLSEVFYAAHCGEHAALNKTARDLGHNSHVGGSILSALPKHRVFFPPGTGWETVQQWQGHPVGLGSDPPPRLHGHYITSMEDE